MKKLFLIFTSLLISSFSYAETTADLIKQICQGEKNCYACTDASKQSLAKCVEERIFNSEFVVEKNDEIFMGALSNTTKLPFCGIPNSKQQCKSHRTELTDIKMKTYPIQGNTTSRPLYNNQYKSDVISGSLVCNRNQCLELLNIAEHFSSSGGYTLFDIDYKNSICTYYHHIGDSYERYVSEPCNYTQSKRIIYFNSSSIPNDKWNDKYMYIEADNNGNNLYRKLPLQLFGGIYFENIGTSVNVHTWYGNEYEYNYKTGEFTYNYKVNIRVPMDTKIIKQTYTCPDESYPCSTVDNINYYCTPTPCFTLNPDNSLTEADKKPDNLTPEYIAPDNGTCAPDMSLYLFTPIGGKHKECRQEGMNVGSNDLTSPNQCTREESLSNGAKDSLLNGLNNTFDELQKTLDPTSAIFGDYAALISPISFVLKAYELLGELLIRNLAEEPTQEEKELALLRSSYDEDGACHRIGEYCSKYHLDGMYELNKDGSIKYDLTVCARRSSLYCCYDSPIAKAFNKAAREQLPGFTWGENLNNYSSIQSRYKQPKPNCRGLTIDELAKLNINDPRFADEMKAYVNNVLMPELTGPGGMLDITRLTETSKKMADDIQNYYK